MAAERRSLSSPELQVYVPRSSVLSAAVWLLLVPVMYWGETGGSSSDANFASSLFGLCLLLFKSLC